MSQGYDTRGGDEHWEESQAGKVGRKFAGKLILGGIARESPTEKLALKERPVGSEGVDSTSPWVIRPPHLGQFYVTYSFIFC